MWAGGECVTRGYLNLPDKTNERYTVDPFVDDGYVLFIYSKTAAACVVSEWFRHCASAVPRFSMFSTLTSARVMFNTGDLGTWRPDGTLEHLGRIDDQVKIKVFIHLQF
jgi:non-ribosomal peptide synthetase component F